MLGNCCLKELRGGCTLLPKASFALLELIPSCKGFGLVAQPWLGPSGHSKLFIPLDLGPFLCLPGPVWVANTSGKT